MRGGAGTLGAQLGCPYMLVAILGILWDFAIKPASIPINPADGRGRIGDAELDRVCSTAGGPAGGLEYPLLLVRNQNQIKPEDLEQPAHPGTGLNVCGLPLFEI